MMQVSINLNLRVLLWLGGKHPEAAYFPSRVESDSKDHESVFELTSNVHPVKVRILPRHLDALELPEVGGYVRPRRAQTIRRHRRFHSIVELGGHLIEMLLPQQVRDRLGRRFHALRTEVGNGPYLKIRDLVAVVKRQS
jgi:hypothetical protein